MALRIVADEARCVGGGQCVVAAPGVFDQRGEDGVVVVLDGTPSDERRDVVLEAVVMCPVAAIHLEETAE
ncbi:ferredoxin [Streptosporangium becharense]|uniref:Ferredoxin n=1 Tax=Streptosporangium becharense TaxID=1816182 RepID=A0A7W9MIK6_9ACTN|nr:ferredoxin [Streptosporangium becharense]MBB2911393.1 ferredoxin [Streptosporangium becharense]MBB5821549.1 ferredoxin [Streptosporangium becharense]